jgi:hypothetical protein
VILGRQRIIQSWHTGESIALIARRDDVRLCTVLRIWNEAKYNGALPNEARSFKIERRHAGKGGQSSEPNLFVGFVDPLLERLIEIHGLQYLGLEELSQGIFDDDIKKGDPEDRQEEW